MKSNAGVPHRPVVDGERWLEPGDTVTIAAPGLGELTTPIV